MIPSVARLDSSVHNPYYDYASSCLLPCSLMIHLYDPGKIKSGASPECYTEREISGCSHLWSCSNRAERASVCVPRDGTPRAAALSPAQPLAKANVLVKGIFLFSRVRNISNIFWSHHICKVNQMIKTVFYKIWSGGTLGMTEWAFEFSGRNVTYK